MVQPTPKRMAWKVTEAPSRIVQRSLCCSCTALSWFCDLVSSQYLNSMRGMSRWRMLRSLVRCCLEKLDLLVLAGGAAEVLPFSLSCPLPLLRTHPPKLLVCCFFYSCGDGSNQYSIRTVEVNLFLSGKRGGKSHFGIVLVSAVQKFEDFA